MSILLFLFFFTAFSMIYVELFPNEQPVVEEFVSFLAKDAESNLSEMIPLTEDKLAKAKNLVIPLTMQQEIMTYVDPIKVLEDSVTQIQPLETEPNVIPMDAEKVVELSDSLLQHMTVKELKELAIEQGIKFPAKIRKQELIDLIMEG